MFFFFFTDYFFKKADLSLLVADWVVLWAVAGSRPSLSEGRVELLSCLVWERVVIRSEDRMANDGKKDNEKEC